MQQHNCILVTFNIQLKHLCMLQFHKYTCDVTYTNDTQNVICMHIHIYVNSYWEIQHNRQYG